MDERKKEEKQRQKKGERKQIVIKVSLLSLNEVNILECKKSRKWEQKKSNLETCEGTGLRFIGLVKSKKSGVSSQLVRRMWGTDDVSWASIDAVERHGGIICM